MHFTFKDKQYEYPATLDAITLQRRIDFQNLYGKPFEEHLKALSEIEDLTEREILLTESKVDFAVQSFSFFTGIGIEEVKSSIELSQVMNVYNASLTLLLEEEANIALQPSYEFEGKKWFIAAPMVTPQSKFTFNEFLTSKEITRQLEQVGQRKFEALLHLCCIYLRQENEPFSEDLVDPDGERMALMRQLPLSIAFHVGFFLTSSMTLFLKALQSSKETAVEKAQT